MNAGGPMAGSPAGTTQAKSELPSENPWLHASARSIGMPVPNTPKSPRGPDTSA